MRVLDMHADTVVAIMVKTPILMAEMRNVEGPANEGAM
jgi:hypothetical protein